MTLPPSWMAATSTSADDCATAPRRASSPTTHAARNCRRPERSTRATETQDNDNSMSLCLCDSVAYLCGLSVGQPIDHRRDAFRFARQARCALALFGRVDDSAQRHDAAGGVDVD